MKYIVDTHILLWSFIDPTKLSPTISQMLMNESNNIYYSPINLWEISIKYGLKKLDLKGITPEDLYKEIDDSFYICKEMNKNDLVSSYKLPAYHKDPFDRFLIWEAIRNDFILISADKNMELYKKDGLRVVVNR
jgi:PIN domain nuclease of toxin-antitoxin system